MLAHQRYLITSLFPNSVSANKNVVLIKQGNNYIALDELKRTTSIPVKEKMTPISLRGSLNYTGGIPVKIDGVT